MGKARLLITGASGFLGGHVMKLLNHAPFNLFVTRHTSPLPCDGLFHDIHTDMDISGSMAEAVKKCSPDVILHIAALTNTDTCESDPERARHINVRSVDEMLQETDPEKTRMIFVSTDLVFDGRKGYYSEDDAPNPKMVYAQKKIEAENLIRSWGDNHAILRVSLMYGPSCGDRQSFLGWLEKGLQGGGVTLFRDEYRTPLYVEDAAEALVKLASSDFRGTLHLGGSERCSRYDFGVEFARQGGYETTSIRGVNLKDAKLNIYRPPDVSLDSRRARKVLNLCPLNISEGIAAYFQTRKF